MHLCRPDGPIVVLYYYLCTHTHYEGFSLTLMRTIHTEHTSWNYIDIVPLFSDSNPGVT